MLDLLPWEFLFFVPAVTMRALAEDIRSGQIEVVLAQPLSELELLLGKYLGSVLFLWIALALTLAIPLGLSRSGPTCRGAPSSRSTSGPASSLPAWPAIGVWASSLSRSQITAFILAAGSDVPADSGGTQPAPRRPAPALAPPRPGSACSPTSRALDAVSSTSATSSTSSPSRASSSPWRTALC